MEKGTKVIVRGTVLKGEVVSTRLVSAASTGRGTSGSVKLILVQHKDYQMEYEWLELKKIE